MINPGKYTGRVKDYALGVTQKGDPKVMIIFTFKDEHGSQQELTWTGFLSEKAKNITIDTLLNCGMKGEDIGALVAGVECGVLDTSIDVTLVIENEEYQGKTFPRIKWVNRPGGAAFKDKLTSADVKKMPGLNLKADVLARRKETGLNEDEKLPF